MKLQYISDGKRHLICVPYTIANLHRMARELAINPCWYHAGKKPHYDIPKMRQAEINAKCLIVTSQEIIKIIKGALDA